MELVQSQLGCISWIVFGALAGWVASLITGRNNRQGCLLNIVVGVIGAFLGGALASLIFGGTFAIRWSLSSFAVAVVGATLFLLVVNLFSRR
ncbi:MAG: GlsB/YeaQ/YmgE family stress response membrane protein [Caldilineales bacterium]|nr:GlsB/YeaQ/YmgE family stress response membrane protein [Caldilineales bacterium]MDW8317425.1 GlsB/YeaQ/YmgE family stress response membrane protein [Anaerolineae bacterium]